ncbi:MAG: hypothetical protein AAFX40_13745, partial [Cyanobacteria bacterium J06639_1]
MTKSKILTILAIAGSVLGLVAIAAVGLMLGYSFGEKALEEVSPTPGDPEIRPTSADEQSQSSVPELDRDTLLSTNLVKTLNPTPPPRIVERPSFSRPSRVQRPLPRDVPPPPLPVFEEPRERQEPPPLPIAQQPRPLPTLPPAPVATPPPPAPALPPEPDPPTSQQGTVAMRVTSASVQGANVVLNVSVQ